MKPSDYLSQSYYYIVAIKLIERCDRTKMEIFKCQKEYFLLKMSLQYIMYN